MSPDTADEEVFGSISDWPVSPTDADYPAVRAYAEQRTGLCLTSFHGGDDAAQFVLPALP